ncbi:hypothetical protein J2S92_002813 [Arthrobacter bambusae]|nr:hypothetical protein [Arthrobacter bambusae]MDQ0236658.1 hypothetical protein [Arthrobacter bambusae]
MDQDPIAGRTTHGRMSVSGRDNTHPDGQADTRGNSPGTTARIFKRRGIPRGLLRAFTQESRKPIHRSETAATQPPRTTQKLL